MVSIKTAKCKTPLPKTKNESALAVSSSFIARFRSSSCSKRSLICLLVTYLPSFPKNGESLIVNSILIVGSSMVIEGRASGSSISDMVSPISNPSKPDIAQISPAFTVSTFILARPSYKKSSLTLPLATVPSLFTSETC